jgi:hypothetical protein
MIDQSSRSVRFRAFVPHFIIIADGRLVCDTPSMMMSRDCRHVNTRRWGASSPFPLSLMHVSSHQHN